MGVTQRVWLLFPSLARCPSMASQNCLWLKSLQFSDKAASYSLLYSQIHSKAPFCGPILSVPIDLTPLMHRNEIGSILTGQAFPISRQAALVTVEDSGVQRGIFPAWPNLSMMPSVGQWGGMFRESSWRLAAGQGCSPSFTWNQEITWSPLHMPSTRLPLRTLLASNPQSGTVHKAQGGQPI